MSPGRRLLDSLVAPLFAAWQMESDSSRSGGDSSRRVGLARFNGIVSRSATPKQRLRRTHASMKNKGWKQAGRRRKGTTGDG